MKKTVYQTIAIILLTLLSYSNTYKNEFLWDDEFLIQKNQFVQKMDFLNLLTTPSGAGAGRYDNFYRPTQLIVYSLIYRLFKLNELPYHLINILLHTSNSILILALIKKITGKQNIAFITALLWATHPVHTEAVTYISGTADPLSLFFALISFLLFTKSIILSSAFFILALLSKETIIILPLLIFLHKKDKKIIILSAIAVIYIILRITTLNFDNTLNFYNEQNVYTENIYYRMLTFTASLPYYYSFLLYPVDLHMERGFPIFTSILSIPVLLSIIILLILFLTKKDNTTKLGILWFLISFLPMSGIIPVNSLLLEHWLYVPSIGFFLIIANIIKKYKRILIPIIIILISLTLVRNFDWRDSITFYNNILKHENGSARVYNNLAMAYAEEDNFKAAEEHYLKAIQTNDNYAETRYNLASLYIKQGKASEAITNLKRSIEINPNFYYSYNLLTQIYKMLGNEQLAEEYSKKGEGIKYY